MAIVLLVGAGLMMRTLLAIQEIDPGLDTKNVLVGELAFPRREDSAVAGDALLKQVVENIRSLPGVVAVSPSVSYPLWGGPSAPVTVLGTTPGEERQVARVELVGDEYFRVVGLPLLTGRLLSRADVEGARRVAVVNRRFVQVFLGGADAIGRMARFGEIGQTGEDEEPPFFEVVGVVGDGSNSGLRDEVQPQAFLAYTTAGFSVAAFALRSTVDPLSLQNAVREQVWAADRGVALAETLSLEEIRYRDALAEPSFGLSLLSSFACIGLILATIGVFSVMTYAVSLQTHEIGIRMALGAQAASVLRMVVSQGLRPVLAGVAVGVGATYWLSRVMASQIYRIQATDPWTIAVAVLVLVTVGLVACLLPARRATRVDPLNALRCD